MNEMTRYADFIKEWLAQKPEFENVNIVKRYFLESEIYYVVKEMRGKCNKYYGYMSYVISFLNKLHYIIDLLMSNKISNKILDIIEKKWLGIICSGLNICLFDYVYEEIKDAYGYNKSTNIEDRRMDKGRNFGSFDTPYLAWIGAKEGRGEDENKLLLVGMVERDADTYRVYDELLKIEEIAIRTNKFRPLPLFGCSVRMFKKTIKEYYFDTMHFAGHTEGDFECNIRFCDSSVKSEKFKEMLISARQHPDLIVYNCCNSEIFHLNCYGICSSAIVYDTLLHGKDAYNFSKAYYTELCLTRDTKKEAYDKVPKDEHYHMY